MSRDPRPTALVTVRPTDLTRQEANAGLEHLTHPPVTSISVLLIDDDEEDHLITAEHLRGLDIPVTLEWRSSPEEGLEVLRGGGCDVCLLDYSLGARTGIDVLDTLREMQCATPVIMLTGVKDDDLDLLALRAGATDYLHKHHLDSQGLSRAIRYAIERRRLADEREELERQLRQAQKMEAIGRLSGGLAHDLNNILNVIIANVDLTRSEDCPPTEWADHLSEIRNVARRGGALVRKLLSYSRRDRLVLSHFDLLPTLREMAGMLPRILPESVTIETGIGNIPLPVYGDPNAVHQILLNLATNARDAMPTGGLLVVTAARTELDERFCASHEGASVGEYIAVAVTDNGCGMDPDTAAVAFEPFFTTKPSGVGTGLGLAMVYGLCKQLRGFVQLESNAGVGTRVTLYLPFSPHVKASSPPPSDRAALPRPTGHETILLVEDQLELRRAARRILERAGYDVITAADGTEALARYDEACGAVDLVLTDMIMPNMGGRELYDEISRGSTVPKVLFMSGYSPEHVGDDLLNATHPLLRKPWTLDELLEAVQGALHQGGASEAGSTDRSAPAGRFRRRTP